MLRTFNCGVGMVLVAAEHAADRVVAALRSAGESPVAIGAVVAGSSSRIAAKGKEVPTSRSTPATWSTRHERAGQGAAPGRACCGLEKRVAILISGRGSNMRALAERARPDYPAEVVLVVSNRPQAAGLAWARAHGLPVRVVDHAAYGSGRSSRRTSRRRSRPRTSTSSAWRAS